MLTSNIMDACRTLLISACHYHILCQTQLYVTHREAVLWLDDLTLETCCGLLGFIYFQTNRVNLLGFQMQCLFSQEGRIPICESVDCNNGCRMDCKAGALEDPICHCPGAHTFAAVQYVALIYRLSC